MSNASNVDTQFAGFSGGASGFGDPEFVDFLRSESVVPGTGSSVFGLQSAARRQFIGSAVVAVGIAAIAGLTALRPTHDDFASAQTHRFAVQQPTFATPVNHDIAAIKQRNVELP